MVNFKFIQRLNWQNFKNLKQPMWVPENETRKKI